MVTKTVKEEKKPEKPPEKPVESNPVELYKPTIDRCPFEVWFSIRKKKHTAFRAMQVYAQKYQKFQLNTLEDWDKLFERF